MSEQKDNVNSLAVMAGGLVVGLVLKKLLSEGWNKAFSENPPDVKTSENIDWKKVALWTAISATTITTGQLIAKRGLSIYLAKKTT